MNVQTKILLLLLAISSTLVGGLVALKIFEQRKFQAIAEAREAERNRNFDEFLTERGDNLKVLVEDSSTWDEMVRATVTNDVPWIEQNINDATLATYQANAVWIYRADRTLLYSRNNRYAATLRELPVPKEAFDAMFARGRDCHFFIHVPQGWMEIRGGTIHPSLDSKRETTPKGYFFAGHTWINENIRRMSLFTGYDIRIAPVGESRAQPSKEEQGLITFARTVPGWDGRPVAEILVRHDSPIIRELNHASKRLFIYLLVFAGAVFLVLALALVTWVRRPLRRIMRSLKKGDPEALVPLRHAPNEFGKLAELILQFRHTQQILEQTEERLRHSQKLEAVGRLAGGVAHDFNNLLTAIIGYSELLEAKLPRHDGSYEYAELIRQAGERAAALTKQLLAFSRKQLLQPKVLDLNALITEIQRLLQRVIGEHIRICLETHAADARVLADPSQIEQVVLNLGVNARDAMPRGGVLTITTSRRAPPAGLIEAGDERDGECVVLSVRDTGSGMDDDTKARIFEPFFTTKGPGKGTGLGLSTVYGIVKQSGGGITVESTLGKGSEFSVYLPHEDAPIAPAAAALPPVDRSRKTETILVVEDEEVVRMLLCSVLSEAGYEVLCAATPTEAVKLATEHPAPIELLVTDVVMPEMHGPVLARALAPLQPAMKVLFVSGYSENDISDQGVIEPDLEVLQKPFTQQTLVRKVQAMLAKESVPETLF
jgi:signal transduction histidine kinase/ActR/RegA family two-component response regulator